MTVWQPLMICGLLSVIQGSLSALFPFDLVLTFGMRQFGMCQGVLDTGGKNLVSFDKHSPDKGMVFGALIPT